MARLELDITVPRRRFDVEVSLALDGGTLALAGPSGAGKTTVLQALAGLLRPAAGRIAVDGRTWFDARSGVHLAPERRSVGYVPQDHGLFPHLDVSANVAFGARDRATVPGLLERLGVAHLARERPGSLSGGERQRVALARALAREPAVLCLDEPLAALDAMTRARVRDELGATIAAVGLPTLLVTHDAADAAALADRVAVVVDGHVRQLGTPGELVRAPADPFVVAFTGATALAATGDGAGRALLDDGTRVAVAGAPTGRVVLALHPWQVRVAATPPGDGRTGLQGTVGTAAAQGERVRVQVGPVAGEADAELARGSRAWASWDPAQVVVLPSGDAEPPRHPGV